MIIAESTYGCFSPCHKLSRILEGTARTTAQIIRKEKSSERKSSWRVLHLRFPRISTFAAQRILLRNAPGNAYTNPSAHISGIVHSCPHLGYLNYICNAYRDAVGTEYVGLAHALRLRHRRRRCRRRGGDHVCIRLLTGETHVRMCSCAFSEYTRTYLPAVSRVYAVVSARVGAPSRRYRIRASRVHGVAHAYAHASASMS